MTLTRQDVIRYLYVTIIGICVPCFIALKIPLLPRRIKFAAIWGLGLCFFLILLRLALLAFGD